jgi:hypothetical protein
MNKITTCRRYSDSGKATPWRGLTFYSGHKRRDMPWHVHNRFTW